MGKPDLNDRLCSLWEAHRRAPFPGGFRGVDVAGVELILLDSSVAGLVMQELRGGLGDDDVAILWACITDLDKVLPLIDDEYCRDYYARLRVLAELVAPRYTPSAI
ncbi:MULTISPECIES: hypothetical protein [Streptomyces]|uniref:Uncharacterized protein n=1 Tax=Streptomyces fuscus TaxID=3048495 RepID=A0ABT7J4U0_9ACTN|nr:MULTISPECIES: hypothetical protein [Streptomyces]MCM1977051.1 hypothetical protein [Streptomyces sp. G1]MDL2079885.1 hypothetical protein [Streptomyces fuscus]SBT95194.1 hypothetical protein GA0115233_11226 [Streptomyces sp. DI166]